MAREENITHASESLHISQPSLSKQLMELEQEVGKQLLVRGKRKITLTEEGVLLRKRADEIITLLEKTERELNAASMQIGGEVSIGGDPTPPILNAAAAIRRTFPEIQFRFYSSDATDVTERLDHGSLDLAVLLTPVDTTKYEYLSLPDSARWGFFCRSPACWPEKRVWSGKIFSASHSSCTSALVCSRRLHIGRRSRSSSCILQQLTTS